MSDFDRNYAASTRGYAPDRAVIDAGLRAHMIRVYNYMAIGVALTGLVAWFTFQAAATTTAAGGLVLTPLGQTLFNSPLIWVLMLAPLALVFVLSLGINRLSAPAAQALFFVYAALLGLSLSTIFVAFTETSITRVFFISAAAFGGLSLWGYTTQRDLTGMGSFLIMGLIGIIIASLVNIFLGSSLLQFAISIIGVLVFTGLTAYDTQNIKEQYAEGYGHEANNKMAVFGALSLYLNFINLFQLLLSLTGQREE
ncbi:MAG: Bax inhibitor-1/YccA family protein [Xanthobacteraceae bacterium]